MSLLLLLCVDNLLFQTLLEGLTELSGHDVEVFMAPKFLEMVKQVLKMCETAEHQVREHAQKGRDCSGDVNEPTQNISNLLGQTFKKTYSALKVCSC